jgi:cbb3-type cytochrome oxidase subunit 3
MTLTDATWIFTAIIFSVVTGCVVWILREERKR